MKKRFLASVAALTAGAGLALGQAQPSAPAMMDPATVQLGNMPMTGGIMPAGQQMGKEGMYLQGGEPNPWCPPSGHNHLGWLQNPLCEHGCGDPSLQVHKAAGGPDCFYYDLELLYYYFKSMPVSAPLLTAGPIGTAGLPVVEDGVRVLFPAKSVEFGAHSALRGTLGYWDCDHKWGIEASAFITEQRAEVDRFDGPITGRTVLARPNINVLTGVPDSILIASPPFFGGSAGVYTNGRAGGAELNALRNWCYYDKIKFNTLVGVRWMSLNEQLRVDSTSALTDVNPFDPPIRDITDNITTRNNFYGFNFGLQNEFRWGRWYTNTTAKVALGFTHEKLNMAGRTRFFDNGVERIEPFGAYVLEPNSGKFSDKEWSFLPSISLKVGYNWTQRLSTFIGYDALYLSRVVRPGTQIDPRINPTLLPASAVYNPQFPFGPPNPALLFDTSDFFLQGITAGFSLRY